MERRCWQCFVRIFLLLILLRNPAFAQTPTAEQEATSAVNRGQQISSAISTVTSVAVSPLLGVCVLGVWDYARTPKALRASLPFYTSPMFWIPVGILLILIFIKDTVGGFAPLVKKPLDAIEVLMLNKAALILICFPVLFHQIENIAGVHSFRQLLSGILQGIEPVVYAADAHTGFIDTAGHMTLTVLTILGGSAAIVVVWLVAHSIDVLLLLSPFPFLDVVLKGFKTVMFALLIGTPFISRSAGLALSLLVILICAICAGWAFRLAVFGSIFAWELLAAMLLGWKRTPDANKGIHCFFVGRRLPIRKRTMGRLFLSPDGNLEFRHRRLGFGPWRRVPLPSDVLCEIGRGLLQPSLIVVEEANAKHRILFRMLPGYAGSEEDLRASLGLSRVRDIRIPSGLRAFWRWLSDSGELERPDTDAASQSA